MSITIRLAESEEERQAVYRFRYQIYVEEMERSQEYADHDNRRIVEPLDKTGKVVAAWENDEIVGTARVNFGVNSDLGKYPELYDMNWVGEYFPDQVSITTKMMVATAYRSTPLWFALGAALYEVAYKHGILFDFIDCNRHLERAFIGVGYRPYRERIVHPEYGDVMPLVLLLSDVEHLRKINSPLLRLRTSALASISQCPDKALDLFHQKTKLHLLQSV